MARATAGASPVVLKVGGSLMETGRLAVTLKCIASARRPLVVVSGGGNFADKIRELQTVMQFDDAAAHRLAMIAMHQMADIFVAIEPRLCVVESLDEIRAALKADGKPVWVPLPVMENDRSVPQDWSTTSDTIAARLAELLGWPDLGLIKSVDEVSAHTAEALAVAGVVDPAFPAVVERARLNWKIFGPSDEQALAAYIDAAPPGAVS